MGTVHLVDECAGCYQDVVKVQRTDVKVWKSKVGLVGVNKTTKRSINRPLNDIDELAQKLQLYWIPARIALARVVAVRSGASGFTSVTDTS